MTDTRVTDDSYVVPQDPGTGTPSKDDPTSAAGVGLLAKHAGPTYRPLDGGLTFDVDTANDQFTLNAGYAFVLDDVSDTTSSRGVGGRPRVQSTASSGYDKELPNDVLPGAKNVYVALLQIDQTGLSLAADTDNEVYLIVDVTSQNELVIRHGEKPQLVPDNPSILLGEIHSGTGATARPNDGVGMVSDETTSDPGLAFGTWRTAHSERPVDALINIFLDPSGVSDAIVNIDFDESGGTNADYTLEKRAAAGLGTNPEDATNVPLVPGESYRIRNTQDPNGNNAIQFIRELVR